MKIIALIVHAYLFMQMYLILSESDDNHRFLKWTMVLLIGGTKYFVESVPYTKNIAPFVICTILIIYSMCIRSHNTNLTNLRYALVVYGMDYVISIVQGSVFGFVATAMETRSEILKYFVLSVCRIIIIIVLCKYKQKVENIKHTRLLNIGVMGTVVLLFAEQVFRVSFTIRQRGYTYLAIAFTCLAALFTTLWLLDHYKMAKIQKMYADDNQQMSQKLHRSKEILPMIANYVSTMDGTPDEGMRKKLEEVCHDYGKELGGTQMCAEFIETTGIDLVDLLLRTKIIECGEQDIELNVFVSTQIAEDMKRMDISDGEITRLMGDLLRNSINAVSKLQNRMILLLIARDENDCVLIRIYDSGIPFPPYVLERFGERGNTTWGTGNGIADMMETLRRVHASIEINMDMDAGDVFTKGIFICFDGEDNVNITHRREYPGDAEGRVCF